MSDLTITIDSVSKNFNLVKQNGSKLWHIREEPIVPIKPLSDVPSYGDLNPERILAFVQDNWIGGMGQEKFNDPTSMADKYAEGYGIDTRFPGKLFLGPQVILTATSSGTILGFKMFLNYEYAFNSTKVFKRDTSWSTVLTAPGADTFTCLEVYDGNIYAGLASGKYYYSADGASWTQSTLTNPYADFFVVAPPMTGSKDIFVLGKKPNILRTTINPINGGTEWTEPPYYIGDTSSNITNLFVMNGDLFIAKEDGLYILSNGIPVCILPDFRSQKNASNFKYVTNWQSSIYLSTVDDIMELTSRYTTDFISPLKTLSSLVSAPVPLGLASDIHNLYAAFKIGTTYHILAGRERRDDKYGLRWEWCPLVYLSTGALSTLAVLQKSGANPRLWFSNDTSGGICYCILPTTLDYPPGDSSYRFISQGILITSYFDAGYNTWQKIFYQLWSIAANLSSDYTILVYYEKDTDSSWTLLATILTNGVQYANLTQLNCKKIRLKLALSSVTPWSTTPILTSIDYRGVLKPEVTKILDFSVMLEQTPDRKPSTDLTFLRSGRTSTSVVTIKDLRFGTTRYVSFLTGSPEESEVWDEASKQPVYQARILAQELNWTPP